MWMRFGVAPRRTGMASTDFQAYWKDQHAPVVCGMPGLRLYHQNHAVLHRGEPLLPWPGFDACAQFGAEDPGGFDTAFTSEHYRGPVTEDARRFVDTTRGGIVLCGSPLCGSGSIEAPIGGDAVRLLSFFRCAPSVALATLGDGLRMLEAPADALGRAVYGAVPEAGKPPGIFDAIEILAFSHADAAVAHVLGGEARRRMEPLAGAIRGTERLIARVAVIL